MDIQTIDMIIEEEIETENEVEEEVGAGAEIDMMEGKGQEEVDPETV